MRAGLARSPTHRDKAAMNGAQLLLPDHTQVRSPIIPQYVR